jgi:hypothetical protein
MIFKSRKSEKRLSLYSDNQLVFQGSMSQLPLRENIILEKSVQFFDDPDPCLYHRNAVLIRLLSEIELQLPSGSASIEQCPLLRAYANFDAIDHFSFNYVE